MKIKPEHYQFMKDEMDKVISANPGLWEHYQQLGLSGKRFRWDIARHAKLIPYICDTLYKYLNDEHIDTALRKITNTK